MALKPASVRSASFLSGATMQSFRASFFLATLTVSASTGCKWRRRTVPPAHSRPSPAIRFSRSPATGPAMVQASLLKSNGSAHSAI